MSALEPEQKATPAVAFCFLLNRLLEREPWARDKLAPFAGEAVALRAPPLPEVRCTIQADGRVEPGGATPSLTVHLKPELLAALGQGEERLLRAVEVAGNARLAAEVMLLVRYLRWDLEEGLARVLGDVAAHRVAGAARSFLAWQADAGRRLAEGLADYVAQEKGVLVRRADLHAHGEDLARLRDRLERLDKRIGRLE